MNPGTIKHIPVNAVLHQDLFKEENAAVPTQKLNGTLTQRPAVVHQILLVIIANFVQLQDSMILMLKNVHVLHQKHNGIHQVKNVNVQLENTEIIVLNVQHQGFGIQL